MSAVAKLLKQPGAISVTKSYGILDKLPILTKASGQDPRGVQSFGLPGAKQNKTTLGPYRMGDSDTSSGAIYPDDIFPPNPPLEREYKQVTFENVGNSVYQPRDENNAALHALISRLGDQKFKAIDNEPFAAYFQAQKAAKDVSEAMRFASINDQMAGREIIRNIVDVRRKANEDDYMRRMVDAGLTAEDAAEEIANLRKAAALQEARKVDDRAYQAKLLIAKLSNARGVRSMVNEPLTQSAAIANPSPSAQFADATGQQGAGFGDQPIDAARINMTPAFYQRFLRRSGLTQESGDRDAAMASLIAGGEAPGISFPSQLSAGEREAQLENVRDSIAARLDSLRAKSKRILMPLPKPVIGDIFIERVYERKGKASGNLARFAREDLNTASAFGLLIAINVSLLSASDDSKIRQFRGSLSTKPITEFGGKPNKEIRNILKNLAIELNDGLPDQLIPFAGEVVPITNEQIQVILENFKNLTGRELAGIDSDRRRYLTQLDEAFAERELPVGAGIGPAGLYGEDREALRAGALAEFDAEAVRRERGYDLAGGSAIDIARAARSAAEGASGPVANPGDPMFFAAQRYVFENPGESPITPGTFKKKGIEAQIEYLRSIQIPPVAGTKKAPKQGNQARYATFYATVEAIKSGALARMPIASGARAAAAEAPPQRPNERFRLMRSDGGGGGGGL